MGNNVAQNRTQKDYRPQKSQVRKDQRTEKRMEQYDYERQIGRDRANDSRDRANDSREKNPNISALPPRPNKTTTSVIVGVKQQETRGVGYQSNSNLRPPHVSSFGKGSHASVTGSAIGHDKMVKMGSSTVYVHTEKNLDNAPMVSAVRMRGFEGEEYAGKKLKKFNISIDVVENEMIKESGYFDENTEDIGVNRITNPDHGNFEVGKYEDLGTFAVQTYLFDCPLKERMR